MVKLRLKVGSSQQTKLHQKLHFVLAVLMKRYPYLDMYRQIWGGRRNVIPPSTCEMTQIGEPPNDSDTTDQVIIDQHDELLSTAVHPIDIALEEDDVPLIGQLDEPLVEEVDERLTGEADESLVEEVDEILTDAQEDSGNLNALFNDGDFDEEGATIPTTTKAITPSIAQAGKNLVDGVSQGVVNSAKGAYDNIMKMRVENSNKRFDLELKKFEEDHEKFEFEQFKFNNDRQYRSRQMEMEFEFKERELDFKMTQEENRIRIRMEELKVEKMKWKAVLAKYQVHAEEV